MIDRALAGSGTVLRHYAAKDSHYGGAADGPSGIGPGSGDAIVVETGGAVPAFAAFATQPIARTGATTC
jgi:hypothetical protein